MQSKAGINPPCLAFSCITGFSNRQNKKILHGFVLSTEYLRGEDVEDSNPTIDLFPRTGKS